MLTTLDWISALKTTLCISSDYGIAKHLGISKHAISKYRRKNEAFGPKTAEKVAEVLQVDPAILFASSEYERAKSNSEKDVWQGIYEKIGGLQAEELIRKNIE
ncbi:hypothetical protein [Chitinivorax sp. B]|uniref:helix-turn-helix domain-containing protein n=1 Tax=Chitinivorax sp. B TaxID=2502235 RepID=UPI0010F6B597|nr:hypothetical protein [Chitinivorax sp. B]